MPRVTELCWNQAGAIYSSTSPQSILFCGPTKIMLYTGYMYYNAWIDYTNPSSPYVVSTTTGNLALFSAPDSSSTSMVYYGAVGSSSSPGPMTINTRTIHPFTEAVTNSSVTLSNVTTSGSVSARAVMVNGTPIWSTNWAHNNPNYTGSVLYSNTTKLLDHSTGGTVYTVIHKLSSTTAQYSATGTSSIMPTYSTVTTSSASTTNVPRVDLVYGGAYYHKGTGGLWDSALNTLKKYDTNFVEQWSITVTDKSGEDVYLHLLGAYNGFLYAISVPASSSATTQVCTIHKINPQNGDIINSYDFANSTTGFKNKDDITWSNSCNALRNVNRVKPIVSYNGYFAFVVTSGAPMDIITIKVP